MNSPENNNEKKYDRLPAIVLGCLIKNTITVIVLPGNGFVDGGLRWEIPLEIVPFDLRMPNSEFYLLWNRERKDYIKVLRKGE